MLCLNRLAGEHNDLVVSVFNHGQHDRSTESRIPPQPLDELGIMQVVEP